MSLWNYLQPKVEVKLQMPQEKTRDIDSEIDWKIIDQLHNAVLNFSRNSMQAKKIMFSFLGVFIAVMTQNSSINYVVKWFPVIIGVVLLFWAFDSFTYYYQEKLRAAMDIRFEAIKKRYTKIENEDSFTLSEERQKGHRFWRSVFNVSIIFYPVIIAIVLVCWVLIEKDIIQ